MSSLDRVFESPEAKQRHVRRLFATIADRYDLITRVLSYGMDGRWKRRLIRLARVKPTDRVLDLATGTGDVAFAAASAGAQSVLGLDVTHRMIVLAHEKAARDRAAHVQWVVGDMVALPCPSASMTLVTTSYGLRNVPDLDTAIAEIARVLAPGGRLLSLDFNRPAHPLVLRAYLTYLFVVGGLLGRLLHGDPDTYRYIPASIARYPGAGGVAARLETLGFGRVQIVPVLFGLMTIHVAVRRGPADPSASS